MVAKRGIGEVDRMSTVENNLEKAKVLASCLKNTDLPSIVKQQAVIGVALGVPSEAIVRGMVSTLDAIETAKVESTNPKPDMPGDYTEVERMLVKMLTENTGASILDSGFAYGRHWERNREVKDFRSLPEVEVTVWKDGQVDALVNIFHYLRAYLDLDDTTKQLNREFDEFEKMPEYDDRSWLKTMEAFVKSLESRGLEYGWTFNTYNDEYNVLSQIIQGTVFFKDGEDNAYVALQIHNGCDVRGGYTRPRIFRIIDYDNFFAGMDELCAGCECMHIYSDGACWYDYDGKKLDALPSNWKPKLLHKKERNWKYYLECENCMKKVTFSAALDH